MKISFMTWVCPDWDLNQVLTAAVRYGYDGVEPRAEANQKHGVEIASTKKQRAEIRSQFADMGGINLQGILAILLAFVLAAVFERGAAMRDELEGTV